MVTSFIAHASTFAMNSLYAGVCSLCDWPFFETSCQSMTPSSTIASQNRIVFAVELEFTIASLISYRAVPACLLLAAPSPPTTIRRRSAPGRQIFQVPVSTVRRRKSITDPHLFRCGSEAKVIGLQCHAPFRSLVEQHGQPQRSRFGLAEPAQQKILRHTALDHCVHHQDVPAIQVGPRAEINLAPRVPAVLHVRTSSRMKWPCTGPFTCLNQSAAKTNPR